MLLLLSVDLQHTYCHADFIWIPSESRQTAAKCLMIGHVTDNVVNPRALAGASVSASVFIIAQPQWRAVVVRVASADGHSILFHTVAVVSTRVTAAWMTCNTKHEEVGCMFYSSPMEMLNASHSV